MIPESAIREQLRHTLEKTDFPGLGKKYEGKVRDNYSSGGKRIIIATDRISAFDRVLGTVPFKGQVLTQMAAFWFEKTKDIVSNHLISMPDPNVMAVRECEAVPVEMVVREYVTGVTKTSIWHHYSSGVRNFCGIQLPEGLRKDQKLDRAVITPSTKAEKGGHDESVSPAEIVQRGLLSREEFDELAGISLRLFARGREIAAAQGIILVDTKYEFGRLNGKFVLIDEIHTPDSSRFWYADSYQKQFSRGEEQRKIDKEYVRSWLRQQGFTGEGKIPEIPDEVRVEAAKRYIEAYEHITGQQFRADVGDVQERISNNLQVNAWHLTH